MKVNLESWAIALELMASYHGLTVSAQTIKQAFAWSGGSTLDEHLKRATQRLGLAADFTSKDIRDLAPFTLPVVAELKTGDVAIVINVGAESLSCVRPELSQTIEWNVSLDEINDTFTGRVLILTPVRSVRDRRLSSYLASYTPSWFWTLVLADKKRHVEIAVASFLANLLALGSSLFAMQVWDRVVPSQSVPTLWVLASGVAVCVVFEFILRSTRVKLADILGKKVDLTISSMFFGRALDIRNDVRSKSTGAFIAQLRETETIRESVASTTLTAAVDIPFAITFLFVIWMMAGSLVLAVTVALPLIIIPGLLLQVPLARLSGAAAQEGALRNAILVEAVEGIEDIKALQAETRFHRLWDKYTYASSKVGLVQRQYVSTYIYWISSVQQLCYVAVIVSGVYMVLAGELTTGGVIGASMLTSRALSPFAQFAHIFTKWQSAKTARKALDDLLAKPLDHDADAEKLRKPVLSGSFELENVEYQYDPEQPAILRVGALRIQAGEKVALIGRNGAGKSTLLKVLASSLFPSKGTVSVDGANMAQIDVGDLRNNTSLLSQESRLFHGSLKENLKLGSPLATEDDVTLALNVSGAIDVIKSLPKGLETGVLEGGAGLSGGQKQSIMLARTLLRNTPIVLLDEPTSAMDEASEKQFIAQFGKWMEGRTVVISTHRPLLLELVDRIIVMDRGRIVLDDTKEVVLKRLAKGETKSKAKDIPDQTAVENRAERLLK